MPSPSVVSLLGFPLKKDWESIPAAAMLKEKSHDAFAHSSMVHAYRGSAAVDPNAPPAALLAGVFDSVASAQAVKEAGEKQGYKAAMESLMDTSNPAIKPMANIFELNDDFAKVAAAAVVLLHKWEVPADKVADFNAAWSKMAETTAPTTEGGLVASAYGWGIEEHDGAKTYLVAAGWESAAKADSYSAEAQAKGAAMDAMAKPEVRYVTLEKVK